MGFLRNQPPLKYTRLIEEELNPEEKRHREAQFQIYKTLLQVDELIRKQSPKPTIWLVRLRVCKLKLRFGRRLRRLRRTVVRGFSKARSGLSRRTKGLGRLFHGGTGSSPTVASLSQGLIA